MTMFNVPAGEFLMGLDDSPFAPERPQHLVFLDDFWIDRNEVSNAQYRLCVEAGACTEPRTWGDANFNTDDQPSLVPWESAEKYCLWAGGRLPTEAEWEKAARGTDGRIWPWGNEFEANRANLAKDSDGYGFTAPIGSFPGDASPYGLLDVAGNAAEWVADWYDAEYYTHSPAQNPTGPAGGDKKVQRGTIANAGGGPEKCRCVARYAADPNWDFGFRCAATAPPETDAASQPAPAEEQASDEGVAAESDQEPAAPAAEAPPEGEAAPAGSGPADIPIYPGARLLGEITDIPDQFGTDYEAVGSWGYESEAGVEEAASFYLAEMPKYGWEKIMHIPMGTDSYLSVWQKGGGQLGATIGIGKQENGMTHIGITEAKKR
jgi:hypothetical protein